MRRKPFARKPTGRVLIPLSKLKTGFVATQEPHEYFNQAIFESVADLVWGTQDQVKISLDADFYTDGSGNPLDLDDFAVTINEDSTIIMIHDVTQTANLLLDAGGKRISIATLAGLTLDMDTFDLTLGGSGDNIAECELVLSGTGNLIFGGLLSRATITHDTMIIPVAGNIITNGQAPDDLGGDSFYNYSAELIIVDTANLTVRGSNLSARSFNGGIANISMIDLNFTNSDNTAEPSGYTASTYGSIWVTRDYSGNIGKSIIGVYFGIVDSVSSFHLNDSTATFLTSAVHPGDYILNRDTTNEALVVSVNSENQLSLTKDIFPTNFHSYGIHQRRPMAIFNGGHQFGVNIGFVWRNSGGQFTAASPLLYLHSKMTDMPAI